MANLPYTNSAPSTLHSEMTHDASLEASVGDLMYYDAAEDNMKPAGQFTDYGTAADTQRAFAALFAGLSLSPQSATDSTGRLYRGLIDTIVDYPCVSSTFAVGDYVAPTYTAGLLSDQQVTKVTDVTRAIGKVIKSYTSATTSVRVRMTSPVFSGVVYDRQQFSRLGGETGWRAQTIAMGDAAVTLTRIPGSPTGTLLNGNWLLVDAESSGTENLLLPPEANMTGEILFIKNTGGETINLQNDAAGAVATIATGEIAIAFCDGATWTVIQAIETT